MNHASLFSGIGGFDLAAREVGWNNVFQCEIDPFCQSVLKYYFPKTVLYEDIKRTDFTSWKGKIDVLTGGFPCQPFSVAGQRKGASDPDQKKFCFKGYYYVEVKEQDDKELLGAMGRVVYE